MRVVMCITGAVVLMLWVLGAPNANAANKRYASIVVVENTGEILHARHIDAPRHPASLTKVMSLYLLFEALEKGDIGWDDHLRISAKAARAHPSKMGLVAGTTISVEDLVRALVTKSANDAAIVLAERLGGGEARFARMMTRKARALGMRNTTYVNASGLPDRRQVTTARDMAILAYRIHHDFPRSFRYFSLQHMVWNGQTFNNHNGLLFTAKGVDGLKTGYTHDSGYNLALTARRGDQRLIIVVFGAASQEQRTAHASALLEHAYSALKARRDTAKKSGKTRRLDVPDLQDNKPLLYAGLPAYVAQGDGAKRGVHIIIDDQNGKALPRPIKVANIQKTATPTPKTPPVTEANTWRVQVGAFYDPRQARARLAAITRLNLDDITADNSQIAQGEKQGRTLYRARFGNLTAPRARTTCAALNTHGTPCFTVPPQAQ